MAKTYTYLASSPDVNKITGMYFNEKNKPVTSSPYSITKENIDAVMELSLRYVD